MLNAKILTKCPTYEVLEKCPTYEFFIKTFYFRKLDKMSQYKILYKFFKNRLFALKDSTNLRTKMSPN